VERVIENLVIGEEPRSGKPPQVNYMIFLSYCHKNEIIANSIDSCFTDKNIKITRDIRDLKFTQSIKKFMSSVRDADYVIMIISKDFLESKNCMYEVSEFVKDKDFKDRIIPIITEESKIFDIKESINYYQYWKNKKDDLEKVTKPLSREKSASIDQELKEYADIEFGILAFISTICDMNAIVVSKDNFNNEHFTKILNHIHYNNAEGQQDVNPKNEPTKTIIVGEPKTIIVGEPKTIIVGEPKTITVGEPKTITVGEPKTITVGEPETIIVGGPETITVGEPETIIVGEPKTIIVGEPKTIIVGSLYNVEEVKPQEQHLTDKMLSNTTLSTNIKDRVVKIWKDPVWSKVIATAIIFFVGSVIYPSVKLIIYEFSLREAKITLQNNWFEIIVIALLVFSIFLTWKKKSGGSGIIAIILAMFIFFIGRSFFSPNAEVEDQKMQIDQQAKKNRENDFKNFVNNLDDFRYIERIFAIDSLYKLAYNYPNEFLEPVCEIFCGHIRVYTRNYYDLDYYSKSPSKDIQKIIDLLFKKDGDSLIFSSFKKSLYCSYLYGADFKDAILNNVDFTGTTLSNSNFHSATLSDVSFSFAILNDMFSFENAELSNVDFKRNKIKDGIFRGSILTGVNFVDVRIDDANFSESVMTNVRFGSDSLVNVNFLHASYKHVDFSNSYFYNVDFFTRNNPNGEYINFKETIFEDSYTNMFSNVYYSTTLSNSQSIPPPKPIAPQAIFGVVGQGKFGIVIASRPTKEEAKSFALLLSAIYRYDYEIIEVVIYGKKTYRVFVDSFDDWSDRYAYEQKWKNNPDCRECKDAWSANRIGKIIQ